MPEPNVQVNDKVTLKEKLGFMFFGAGGTAIYYFRSYYYLFFLTNVLHLSAQFAGSVVAIGTIWDAVNDLLIGYLVSRHVFKNGEQLRPYALFIFPLALNTALLFCKFPVETKVQGTLSLVLYLLVSVFFTYYTTAQNNIALVTRDPQSRVALGTFNSFGTTIGTAFGSLACLPLLKAFGALNEQGNIQDGSKFVWVATTICGVATLCVLVYYFCVRERYHADKKNSNSLKLFDALKYLVRERLWVNNVLHTLMLALATSLVTTNIAYYATYELHSTSIVTKILLINTICSVLVYLFIGKITAKIGRDKTLYLSFLILALGKLIFMLFPHSIYAAYANVISIGIATAPMQIVLNVNRNYIADAVDEKQHVRVDGMVSTTVTFVLKFASAAATYLTTSLLGKVGFDGALAEQTPKVMSTLEGLMGWIPLVIIAVIVVLTVRPSDFKKKD